MGQYYRKVGQYVRNIQQMSVEFTHEGLIMGNLSNFLPMTKMLQEENRQKLPMNKGVMHRKVSIRPSAPCTIGKKAYRFPGWFSELTFGSGTAGGIQLRIRSADLLLSVIRLSVETVTIVKGLPAV